MSSSYDGQGDWTSAGDVTQSESDGSDFDQYAASLTTLAGGTRGGDSDSGSQSRGSGTYSASYDDDSSGVNSGLSTDWGVQNGQVFQDESSTLDSTLSDGTSDVTQGFDSWESYAASHSDQTSLESGTYYDSESNGSSSESGGDGTFDQAATSTSSAGASADTAVSAWSDDLASNVDTWSNGDDNGVFSGSNNITTTSSAEQDTSATDISNTLTSSGFSSLTDTLDWWQGDTLSGTSGWSDDGAGNSTAENDSTSTASWGDAYNDHDTSGTSLTGGGTSGTTSDTWGEDSGTYVVTSLDDLSNGVDNGSDTTSREAGGSDGGDWSDTPVVHPFSASYSDAAGDTDSDSGTETDAITSGWSYTYGDNLAYGTLTSDNDVSTFYSSTHNDSGGGDTTGVDTGSDTFNAVSLDSSTGTSTQYAGSEQFDFGAGLSRHLHRPDHQQLGQRRPGQRQEQPEHQPARAGSRTARPSTWRGTTLSR